MKQLNVIQKNGDPNVLDGRLTVYAKVDLDVSDIISSRHPVESMVNNGFLVVQGNYRDQNNLRDFLKNEMGVSLEDGLGEFVEKLEGLESALDPDKLKEKIQDLGEMQDFIPTPAKMVSFNSEDEINSQEGDVYFVGTFSNVANANLSVNSLPILYQARFREQQIENVRDEIEMLVSQVEHTTTVISETSNYLTEGINIEEKILKEFIPQMLYFRTNKTDFDNVISKFTEFLKGYPFDEDIDKLVSLVSTKEKFTEWHYKMLELYAKKIVGICKEDFISVNEIKKEISDLQKKNNNN